MRLMHAVRIKTQKFVCVCVCVCIGFFKHATEMVSGEWLIAPAYFGVGF